MKAKEIEHLRRIKERIDTLTARQAITPEAASFYPEIKKELHALNWVYSELMRLKKLEG